jgi:RHS repeat-associated protein
MLWGNSYVVNFLYQNIPPYGGGEILESPYPAGYTCPANFQLPPSKPAKTDGCGCNVPGRSPKLGDPIDISTGNQFETERDSESGGDSMVRYYNSDAVVPKAHMGVGWRHIYDRSISVANANGYPAIIRRQDGQQYVFTKTNGVWLTDSDLSETLTEVDNPNGSVASYILFITEANQYETYSTTGVLLAISDGTHTINTFSYTVAGTLSVTGHALPAGLLRAVVDAKGRTTTFDYDDTPRVALVTLPDGGHITYSYNASNYLSSVTYPDSSVRQYLYDEAAYSAAGANQGKLTGITDESGLRYATFSYQGDGRAISSQHGQGADLHAVSYSGDWSGANVTYPSGSSVTLSFANSVGTMKVSGVSGPCGPICNQPYRSQTYDTNGYPALATDFNGNVTATTYSSSGLLIQKVEAQGQSNQRTTNFTWNTTLRVPLNRTVLDATNNTVSSTQWLYNSAGQVLTRCDIDPTNNAASSYTCSNAGTVPAGVHRSTYTYCTAVGTDCPLVGLLLTDTGPRTDLPQSTSYTYYTSSSATNCGTPGGACYQPGDLYQVTDALGHVTTMASYDASGRVTRITNANGVNADMTYTPRGWLATRTIGGAITTIGYTPYGAVASIKDADGVTVNYTYDSAHRLTKITDALGNYVQYTLDAAGNKTAEQTYDSTGMLRRSLSRTYNTLGQLTQVTDGLSHAVFNAGYSDSYDANGNLVHTADALGVQRKQGYDGLNRLISTIDNYNGTDTATQNTQSVFAYDANDRLEGVGDPDGLNTTYSYDGLGNATGVQSPDTGGTTYVFDSTGNVTQRTDAKGVVSNSTYDALNRRTATTYADGTLNVAYGYDEPNSVTGCPASYPIGRLTRIIETAVTTVYCYNAHGNVTRKSQTQGTVTDVTTYGYTLADRLASTLTPAGTSIQYSRDAAGRISGVTALPPGTSGTGTGNVVTAISYLPFGPIASYTLGNGQTITRTYDANYSLTDVVSPALNLHFARDAMGNITALGNAPGANPAMETYSYDPLYRLTGLTDSNGNVEEAYTYSKTGDRLSKTASGLATGVYAYQAGTHHLASIGNASRAYDANGNTTGSVVGGDTFGFGYNGRNRMTVAQRDGSTVGTYTYNALGQRVAKVATFPASISQRFVYDENSKLLSEYGSATRDYVLLDGMPVATVDTTGTTSIVSYVTVDGLNTPRAVSDSNGNTIWQWSYQGNPFGEQQPTSANGYTLNLRFMGQYYDAESGLSQNGYRDYEAARGGYEQPDPLGPAGGPNPFAYVGNNPMGYIDPLGLAPHHYAVTDFICSVSQPGCTPQNVFDRLRQYPAPFSDPSHPINTGDTETIPWLGPVVHSVDPSNCSITNTTLPGHKLYPGQVTRSVVNDNGMISIVTDGTGDGPMSALNDALAYPLWSTVDGNISAPWIASPPVYTDAPIEAGLHWGH